jgi:hypothetical protein
LAEETEVLGENLLQRYLSRCFGLYRLWLVYTRYPDRISAETLTWLRFFLVFFSSSGQVLG